MAAATSSCLAVSCRGPELRKPDSVLLPVYKSYMKYPSSSAVKSVTPLRLQETTSPRMVCSVSSVSDPEVRTGRPDDLVASILAKVVQTDGGVSLKAEEHKEVSQVAQELQKYCVPEPLKSPLIFGEWDVVYCSRPTSPGGSYRSALGRLVFRTKDMIQAIEAPDIVRNKVSFSAFGFLDGDVSLKGKLNVLEDNWIQVIFEPPQLRVGSLQFQYGGQSEAKLQITYIDEQIRLGKGSRGSLFVFQRRK